MTATGIRPARAAAVLGLAIAVVTGVLWVWWPAGVALGVLVCAVATVLIGRHLQAAHESVPDDAELLELLHVAPSASAGRVTRTVLAAAPARGPGGASIR